MINSRALFCGWVNAGERLGRGIVTDAITTPVVNTSAYFFKKTAELIDYKVCIHSMAAFTAHFNIPLLPKL